MNTASKLEKALGDIKIARLCLKEVSKEVEVTRELSMLSEIEDNLLGAIKFLEKRDG